MKGAAAVVARPEGDAVVVGPLFQAAKVALSFSLVPLAAVVATNARTMSSTRVVVRCPTQFGPVVAVRCRAAPRDRGGDLRRQRVVRAG